jgi:poly-gamma-glutamate capsule biosynthesis protein CapA/YwtB (metallophosphatase superfamily)
MTGASDLKKINLIATGDSLITMKQSVHSEPRFLEMVELIRGADIAFTNLEMLLHDYEDGVYPAEECGGTYTRADPSMIEELKWMGFDIVSTANNHCLDYMYGGLFKTIEHLDAAGIPHAGTGRDLAQARQPAYLETPQGRVALVAASSSFAAHGRAGTARRDMQGRPGLNPLRGETYYVVTEEMCATLRGLEKEIGLEEVAQSEEAYYFLEQKFVVGEEIGPHTKANEGDMAGNLASVQDATRQADWVLFSLHAHQGRPNDREQPAEFIEEFSRACIDAGAHAVICHGHHALRGIEIRDGRPIFYSLGNFIFQNETVLKMPADFYERYKLDPYSATPSEAYAARQEAPPKPGRPIFKWFTEEEKYWISILPHMAFEGERLKTLRLYPIELGQSEPRSQRGRPKLAEPDLASKILQIIKGLSEPYGTEMSIENGVGIVRL